MTVKSFSVVIFEDEKKASECVYLVQGAFGCLQSARTLFVLCATVAVVEAQRDRFSGMCQ